MGADVEVKIEISANAPDGVPEALEADDGSWLLGVQWHPEASDKRALFHSFAHAASANRAAAA